MLTGLKAANYKALLDVAVGLRPLTVFVGRNASGKTSMLEAVSLLCSSMQPDALERLSRVEKLVDRLPRTELARLSASFAMSESRLCLTRGSAPEDDRENYWQVLPEASASIGLSAKMIATSHWRRWDILSDEERAFFSDQSRCAFLRMERSQLAAPSYFERGQPRLRGDGYGLASTLLDIKANHDECFAKIDAAFRQELPSIKAIRFQKSEAVRVESQYLERNGEKIQIPTPVKYAGDELLFNTLSGDTVRAKEMSDGTLLLLAYLTVLYGPSRPNILLIDDIDRGLHPLAQRELVKRIKDIQQRDSSIQVIATTHSPYLVDELEADEVRLMSLHDGHVECRPLESHPDYEKWRREFSPGEMWSMFGETWDARTPAGGGA